MTTEERICLAYADQLNSPPDDHDDQGQCQCGHSRTEHYSLTGCLSGWEFQSGVEGCMCVRFKTPARAEGPERQARARGEDGA